MTAASDFLVEIGTEELPPKVLKTLMTSFATSVEQLLGDARLSHDTVEAFASPRRLAVRVNKLQDAQEDRKVESKGPPVKIAFADDGSPKPPALAFAKKCGVDVSELQRTATDKGEWLTFTASEKGVPAAELLPGIVEQSLSALPIPRRMRWGDSDTEFVRPVHWVLMIHGASVVPGSVMGHTPGRVTRGHRFMSSGEIEIAAPDEYGSKLELEGHVLADFEFREQRVRDQVVAAAAEVGGTIAADEALVEEVAALTEWPVAMTGKFDEAFLQLPPEVIIASLTGHQRYFPIVDPNGALLSSFIVVANLESKDPDKVRDGNERVIRPRLSDAAFFWDADQKSTLEERRVSLERVVYQKGLGSMQDKSARVEKLCAALGDLGGISGDSASRAAQIAKCDLMTGMVGEFPELQGVMGAYYAAAQGEPDEVVTAIREQYQPRFAGDALPSASAGQLLALADKLDTLAGIFALGQKPSGNKDPFGLRRAALGVVRILVECKLEIAVADAVNAAVRLQPVKGMVVKAVAEQLDAYITDRLRGYYTEQPGITVEIFEAVNNASGRAAMSLPDFDQRIAAVKAFASMSEAESLAAANKRISNILQKADDVGDSVLPALLAEDAELELLKDLGVAVADVKDFRANRDYAAVLKRLAGLRDAVDRFFDDVMVMVDDDAVRNNRLALLACLREPFLSVADISRLSQTKKSG